MWIRPLREADATCGAKALGLARLLAAGLRVPDGFVLDRRAFHAVALDGAAPGTSISPDPSAGHAHDASGAREHHAIGREVAGIGDRVATGALPAELEDEVRGAVAGMARLAVRSSASLEDGAAGAAAGVFSSVTDVAPDGVWDAIRAVWTSALTPLAVAYARRRAAEITIAVIVQRFAAGARVTVYTRPLGAPAGDELWIQRGEALEKVPRGKGSPEADAALAAEAAIGATAGADVELVIDPDDPRPWIVQARPMVHPARRERRAPPPILLAPLVHDGRRWTWDITHNPDPLSPAQAGLVAAVERAGCAPYAMQVCAGYLYTASRVVLPPTAPPRDRAELAARLAAIEARIVLDDRPDVGPDVGPDDAPISVPAAVARYVAVMQIWACELSPLVAAARGVLLEELARDGLPPGEVAARAAALIGPRRVLRDPVMAPAWDVVVPTFAEHPPGSARTPRASHVAGLRSQGSLPPEAAPAVELARAAADAAETDDLWFARAQWLVRRALIAHGQARGLRGDDVFWLPLDDVIAERAIEPDDAQRRASAARAAWARAASWDMPRVVHGDVIDAPSRDTLRGVGFGARVVGRVVRIAALGAPVVVEPGDIVVARAITPALAMVVEGCAALVSETGGLLDHGAALARELGIPCVVGCAGAWHQLSDGAMIAVDGDAGLITMS